LALPACRDQSPYPETPGTLFIHQQICGLDDFKSRFFTLQNGLKGHGFLSYRLYRDPKDPKAYILVFPCSNLREAVEFLQSPNFFVACVGAGMGMPLMWAGVEDAPSAAPSRKPGALVVGRYEGGKGDWSALRGEGTLYHMAGHPEEVILAREVPDLLNNTGFMDSREVKKALDAAGVKRLDLWIGTWLESGNF
jgi:hypothetical protein